MACGFNDVTLYYNDSNHEKEVRFTEIQNVITDLYVYYWGGYKPPKTSRISIDVSSEDRVGSYFGSVLGPSVKIDMEYFWEMGLYDQYKILLESIHRITMKSALFHKWNTLVFENAYNKIVESNYKYAVEYTRKQSLNRKNKASIIHEKNDKYGVLYATFYDLNDILIDKVELIKIFQVPYYYGIEKRCRWFKNNEFGLSLVPNELMIKVSLCNLIPRIEINPITNSKEYLEKRLIWFQYQVFKSVEERREWAQL